MKNLPIIKNSMLVALAVIGMNMMTSCESCSRKDGDSHDDDMAATHDTVYIDTCMTPKDTLVRDGASGMYVPKGQRPAGAGAGSGGGKAGTAGTGTASAGTAKNTLTQEEIDDRVENSSSQATKNGKPINSGGTSGTGTGTGTGSTGNNSKVTTKKDQLKN